MSSLLLFLAAPIATVLLVKYFKNYQTKRWKKEVLRNYANPFVQNIDVVWRFREHETDQRNQQRAKIWAQKGRYLQNGR